MPQRAATIESLPMAFAMVKAMQADGLEWGEGYRPLGRQALVVILEGHIAEAVDAWVAGLHASARRAAEIDRAILAGFVLGFRPDGKRRSSLPA